MHSLVVSLQVVTPCERFLTHITGIHVVWSVSNLQMI